MKQHYLPQFYLKGFCAPDIPKEQEPFLWCYDFKKSKWMKRAPNNIAAISDFYKLKFIGEEYTNTIEDGFAKIEANAADVIRKRILKRKSLDVEQRAKAASFFVLFLTRVPFFREAIEKQLVKRAKMDMKVVSSDPELFEQLKRDTEERTGEIIPDDFGPDDFNSDNWDLKIGNTDYLLLLMLSPLKTAAYELTKKTWSFFHTNPPNYFITSDYPFIMTNKKVSDPGLALKDTEITFPISSTVLFFARRNNKFNLHIDVSDKMVKEMNKRTLAFAQNFVISPKNSFIGDEYIKVREESKKQPS